MTGWVSLLEWNEVDHDADGDVICDCGAIMEDVTLPEEGRVNITCWLCEQCGAAKWVDVTLLV